MIKHSTQTAQILEYLQNGGSLSGFDAWQMFGAYRLGAIIHNLRKRGIKIKTTMQERENGAAYAVYSLNRE